MTRISSEEESADGRRVRAVPVPVPGSGTKRHRIGAKLLVSDGRRAFLIRERRPDGSAFWTLPGGGLAPDESLVDGLRREIDEELGCVPSIGGLVATCRYRHTHRPDTETNYAVFAGRLRSPPDPNGAEGVTGCAWIGPDRVPAALLDPFRRVLVDVVFGADYPSSGRVSPVAREAGDR